MKRRLLSYLFVFTFLLTQTHVFVQIAAAQAGQAELTGEVHDQTRAAITSVRVTLTSVETGRVITTTTRKDSSVTSSDESYRVVGSTLIVNKPGYLVNARYRLDGNRLLLDDPGFSAVLERL